MVRAKDYSITIAQIHSEARLPADLNFAGATSHQLLDRSCCAHVRQPPLEFFSHSYTKGFFRCGFALTDFSERLCGKGEFQLWDNNDSITES